MRLSTFISEYKEFILVESANFAQTIGPPSSTVDVDSLRGHVSFILDTIIADLDTSPTGKEQLEKSKGRGPESNSDTYAQIHATLRHKSGYTITHLVSEYRALRASVLKLWSKAAKNSLITAPEDVMGFNEAIDQALAESVAKFAEISLDQIETERRRLDLVLKAAPVGITFADSAGKLLLANPEISRIWGDVTSTEHEDNYQDRKGWWSDGSNRDGQPLAPHEWAQVRALAGKELHRDIVDIEPFGMPGVRRTVILHGTPVCDAVEKVIGSVVAHIDITGLAKAQVALRESESKFHAITDAIPQMVWSTLPCGYHDYYNQGWYDFTGMEVGSTNGDGWNDLFHPDDQARAWKIWRHSLETGDPYEIQYRLRHHSGEYQWTLGRALPMRDDSGKITRWMGTCTNIHEQKLCEEKLKDADTKKDEFLAMLAHELRNPLAPICAAAEILSLGKIDEPLVKRTSEIILRQVKHMTSLVNDLLDVSRVRTGLIELKKTPQDIRRIVDGAIEQVNPIIRARRHHLMLHVPPQTAMVNGDKERLTQVVVNLLSNAAKYTNEGGNILLKIEVTDASVIFKIEDDGIGMATDLVGRVFELFTQAERTSDRSSGGLGLGLALVKSIVELHDGKVTCTSHGSGLGSQFSVCLPRLLEVETSIKHPENKRTEISIAKRLKILVVDDNVDAALMLSIFLKQGGHEVFVEHQSSRSLELARIEMPDVCILDIGIHGMDGNELAQRLRIQPETKNAVLVAITGYGQEHDRQKSFASGFDHHMVKPADLTRLSEVLASVGAN